MGSQKKTSLVLPPDTRVHVVKKAGEPMFTRVLLDAGFEKCLSAMRRLIEGEAVKPGKSQESITDIITSSPFPAHTP